MLELSILLISIVTMGLMGLLIISRNPRSLSYQLFTFMTFVSIAWDVTNYLSNHIHSYSPQLFANRLSLFIGFLLIIAVWLLSLYFPRALVKHPLQKKAAVLLSVILLTLTLFTKTIVSSVTYDVHQKVSEITSGNFYSFYLLVSLIFFVFLSFNFYKSYHSKKLSVLQQQQIIFVAVGFMLAFVWSILTAAAIPAITHNWEISKYSSAGSWLLVALTTYSILKHKLFDIRLAIARSISYIITFSLLSILFIGPAIWILTKVLNVSLNSRSVTVLVVVTLLVAVIFQPLKNLFNKITNRVFFRDYYEPQEVLDRLSNLLVGTIEVEQTIEGSKKILTDALGCQFLEFEVFEKDKSSKEISIPSSIKSNIISVDSLDQQAYASLHNSLTGKNISLIAKLRTPNSEIGLLLLGYKRSGTSYNDIDKQLVGIAADEIAISLQNAFRFEEIQTFNITLQERVDDATHKLRRVNEKLKALDETKDDFISMASHQLRTPLTSIKGYISMVLEGDAGKVTPKQHEMLGQAFFSSQRMVYLIADLLNISRLNTGKFVIDASKVNLAEVVKQELSQLEETIASHSLTLTYDKPKKFPDLMLDETKTRQVIMNFVDNAIYYTPVNGHINVRLVENPQSVELRVEDDGIGVPKSEQPHLFAKFYRAGNARKARPDGTGLGLFMAKKVVVAQGGSIIFESKEGQGSTFGFHFNKAQLTPDTSKTTAKA